MRKPDAVVRLYRGRWSLFVDGKPVADDHRPDRIKEIAKLMRTGTSFDEALHKQDEDGL